MCLRSQVYCEYTDLYGYVFVMKRTDTVAAVALVVLWSSGFIGAELGTAQAPAHTLLAWRYLAASMILIAWCWYRGLRPTIAGIKRQAVLGFFCQFLYLGLLITGVGLGVSPGTAALIAAMQPLVVAALASRFLGEKFDAGKRVALAVGFAGVVIVVSGDMGGGSASWAAYLLPLAGMVALSSGTVLERKLRTTEPIALALCIQSVVSAILFTGWSLIAGDVRPPMTTAFWTAVAWVIGLSTFGAYGTYMFVLRRSGATRVSALLYLTPATTMVWALLKFGEPVTWLAVLGLAVTLAAVCEWKYISRYVFSLTGRGARRPSDPAARTSRSSAETPGSPSRAHAGSYPSVSNGDD
ncbi:DMT family transporter [Rhodococcus sp. P1Y]|nr:DMT family transporter [Rhodococcus sp. P1Y]